MGRVRLLVALTMVAVTACSSLPQTSGGGLTARMLETVEDGFDGVDAGANHLYALDGASVHRIDPATGQPQGQSFSLHALNTRRAVADDGAIWFTSTDGEPPDRRTGPGGADTALVMPGNLDSYAPAASDESGWLADPWADVLVSFTKDGVAGEPIEVPCDMDVAAPFGSPGALWVDCADGLVRLDTRTKQFSRVDVPETPSSLALTSSGLWARRLHDGGHRPGQRRDPTIHRRSARSERIRRIRRLPVDDPARRERQGVEHHSP